MFVILLLCGVSAVYTVHGCAFDDVHSFPGAYDICKARSRASRQKLRSRQMMDNGWTWVWIWV